MKNKGMLHALVFFLTFYFEQKRFYLLAIKVKKTQKYNPEVKTNDGGAERARS